jgi:hypothetical protein
MVLIKSDFVLIQGLPQQSAPDMKKLEVRPENLQIE